MHPSPHATAGQADGGNLVSTSANLMGVALNLHTSYTLVPPTHTVIRNEKEHQGPLPLVEIYEFPTSNKNLLLDHCTGEDIQAQHIAKVQEPSHAPLATCHCRAS